MTINGKELESLFSMEVLDTDIQTLEVVNHSEWIGNQLQPVSTGRVTYGYSKITVEVLVKSRVSRESDTKNNLDDCIRQISGIVALCRKGILVTNISELEYDAELKSHSSEKLRYDCFRLTLEFRAGAKRVPGEIKKQMTSNEMLILLNSSAETPCTLSITPSSVLPTLTITGLSEKPIKINHLEANKEILIDGELGKVTCEGVNKFGDYDAWEFPRLLPGENTITLDSDICQVTITYKPLYL